MNTNRWNPVGINLNNLFKSFILFPYDDPVYICLSARIRNYQISLVLIEAKKRVEMNTVSNTKSVGANTSKSKPGRRANNIAGVSLLITLTSIAATLTGWAVFANKDFATAPATTTTVVSPVSTTNVVQALPTIEPLVSTDTTTQIAQVSQATQFTTTNAGSGATAKATVQSTTTTVQQAATVAKTAPRTVTTTRSSK